MLSELFGEFENLFGEAGGKPRVFFAPGRVNLIGEHTDYNGGFVFPGAIDLGTTLLIRKRNDDVIKMKATDLDNLVTTSVSELENFPKIDWGSYQAGVMLAMQKKGYNLFGSEMLFHDTIPHGGGLSSSAAIEVATAVAFMAMGAMDGKIDLLKAAQIGQMAENEFIGVNCGIMDQFASAMGRKDHAIMLNCKTLETEYIKLDLSGYKIVVSNTNKKRSLADSKYNERRAECEEGLKILRKYMPKKEFLCDFSPSEYIELKKHITDPTIQKRLTHVILESDRVKLAAEKATKNDIAGFGELMLKSHMSLKDLYEVTGIELDTLVFEAMKVEGCIGARMTGAGFGGCSISIVKEDRIDDFVNFVGKKYFERTGLKASFNVVSLSQGAHEWQS